MTTPSPTAAALAKILAENKTFKQRLALLQAQISEDQRVIGDALEFISRYKIPDTHPDFIDVEQIRALGQKK